MEKKGAGIEIVVDNRSGSDFDEARLRALASSVLGQLGIGSGELGVALVSPGEIEALNRRHLKREGVTDVIAFPLDADEAETASGVPRLLGDVIICPDVAEEQAGPQGNSVDEEMCLLLVHGILHIAGFDHESDSGQMEKLQGQLFQELCR